MKRMKRLNGKTAIITGASSGVGASTALLFARAGANVVICARHKNQLDNIAEQIKSEGGNAIAIAADISKLEDCKTLVANALTAFGRLDILVNNASILDKGFAAINNYSDEDLQNIISVNQIGTMQMTRETIKVMQSGASIINIASVAGLYGGGSAAYVSAKAAIIGITKHTALVNASNYIRCNAICPGTIVTPMSTDIDGNTIDKRLIEETSKHADLNLRPCLPEDIAHVILFLASDDSKAITGQIIVCDYGAYL